MRRSAIIVCSAIVVCAACTGTALAKWLMPVKGRAGFEYRESASFVKVNFDCNSEAEGYSSLNFSFEMSEGQGDSFSEAEEAFRAYDDDVHKLYYFGGMYTLPEGGERVTAENFFDYAVGGEVTLYARWLDKACVFLTLDDLNATYDIAFSLTSGDNTYSVQTSYISLWTETLYISPQSSWQVTVSARTTSVTFGSSECPLSAGGMYSYTALINSRAIVNLPSSFLVV